MNDLNKVILQIVRAQDPKTMMKNQLEEFNAMRQEIIELDARIQEIKAIWESYFGSLLDG